MADLYNLLDELDDENVDNLHPMSDAESERPNKRSYDEASSPPPHAIAKHVTPEVPHALRRAMDRPDTQDSDAEMDDHIVSQLFSDEMPEANGVVSVPNERFARLQHTWTQETHCPKLLPFDHESIVDIQNQIEVQQAQVDELDTITTSSTKTNAVNALLATIGQLDVDRAQFVVSDYLSTRLSKIDAHPLHVRDTHLQDLSDAEAAYLRQYGMLFEQHLRSTVLDHIPEAWQELDEPNMIDKPDDSAFQFWLIKEDVELKDETEHEAGSCVIAKYNEMKGLMDQNKVELKL